MGDLKDPSASRCRSHVVLQSFEVGKACVAAVNELIIEPREATFKCAAEARD
jgi:hypothetical protein